MGSKGQLHIAGPVLSEIQHGFPVGGGEQPSGKRLLLPDGHCVHADDGQGIVVGSDPVPAGKGAFQPSIIHFTLLQIILADGALLGGLHGIVRNADHLAVHLQLEENAQGVTEEVAVTIHAAGAAVPAVAQGQEQFVFSFPEKAGYIIGLGAQVLVGGETAGSQHHIAHPHTIEPSYIQSFGGDVQPPATGWGSEGLSQVGGWTVGLIGLRLAFAGGLFLSLLALPVGAGKGVDGVVTGNIQRCSLRVHPQSLPIPGGKSCLKPGFAPGAGAVGFVPQPDLPAAPDPGPFHSGGVGVHDLTWHLTAFPDKDTVCCQLDLIGGLAQSAGTLPGQKQRAAVHPERGRQVIGFKIGCLHGSAVLSLLDCFHYSEYTAPMQGDNSGCGMNFHAKSTPI